jgi:hypothetical protein
VCDNIEVSMREFHNDRGFVPNMTIKGLEVNSYLDYIGSLIFFFSNHRLTG